MLTLRDQHNSARKLRESLVSENVMTDKVAQVQRLEQPSRARPEHDPTRGSEGRSCHCREPDKVLTTTAKIECVTWRFPKLNLVLLGSQILTASAGCSFSSGERLKSFTMIGKQQLYK